MGTGTTSAAAFGIFIGAEAVQNGLGSKHRWLLLADLILGEVGPGTPLRYENHSLKPLPLSLYVRAYVYMMFHAYL